MRSNRFEASPFHIHNAFKATTIRITRFLTLGCDLLISCPSRDDAHGGLADFLSVKILATNQLDNLSPKKLCSIARHATATQRGFRLT